MAIQLYLYSRTFKNNLNNYQFKIIDHESAEQLRTFWIKSFKEAYSEVHSASDIQTYCTRNFTEQAAKYALTDEQCMCTFALSNEEPVGLSIIIHKSCPLKPSLLATELKHLYLLSSEYGTGLGKALMDDALNKAAAFGSSHVWLCVSNLNFRAFRFYQKLGFEKIGSGPILEVGMDRLPSSIMIRKI